MREKKFRHYHKRRNVMSYSERYPCLGQFAKENFYNYYSCSDEEENYILMDWSGFRDSNGRDIYEEDIIENELKVLFIIKWNDEFGSWYVFHYDSKQKNGCDQYSDVGMPLCEVFVKPVEIVGNLYFGRIKKT